MMFFVWVPYALVSWGYAHFSGGSFWSSLVVLLAVRLSFSVIETLGSIVAWRLYGKRKMIETNLNLLHANNFPVAQYAQSDFLNYLNHIEHEEDYSQQLKMAAIQWKQTLAFYEDVGILLGMRMHTAADEALKIYLPK